MLGNRVLLLAHSGDEDAPEFLIPGWDIVRLAVSQVCELAVRREVPMEYAVLTSRHAARWFVRAYPGFRGVAAASGPATAAILEQAGIACLVPAVPGGGNALALLPALAGEPLLFPCGERTAGTVEALARERGLRLERLVVYRLVPVPKLNLPRRIDALAFFSGQMVEFFQGGVSMATWSELVRLPVLCLKGTAQEALERLGWTGQVFPLEKTPGQSDLSSLLLNMVAPPGSQSSRA